MAAAPPDNRIFIRLDLQPPAWTKQPFAIRTRIAEMITTPLECIPKATLVRTGWAITPSNATIREKVLQTQDKWAPLLAADKVETAKKWHTYVVPMCPPYLEDFDGLRMDFEDGIRKEAKIQTGLEPVRVQLSRHCREHDAFTTWIISFSELPRKRFALFGTSQLGRIISKASPPRQCGNCWDYHPRRVCSRSSKCRNCGRARHDGACESATQCTNCRASHPADDPSCPARPKRSNGVIQKILKPELRRLRAVGDRSWRQHNPAQPPGHP